jgi:predicted nucleic acid-binding protein
MLVIADSSPFVALVKIGNIEVLPKLFGAVVIPPAVADELANPKRPQSVQDFIGKRPQWLSIRKPSSVESIPNLDLGEREAISLARELKADLLLIDETDGVEAAIARHVPVTRTAAILRDAANRGLIDLKQAFERLKATNFRIKADVLNGLLRQHEEFRRQQQVRGANDIKPDPSS